MKTCFVIQKFDNGIYDKRYRETFAPAIDRGGAKPVRADEVLGTRPVVEKIEQGLRSADVAFAEISEDNPNVFLELGYALSIGVPTVIVCDKARRGTLPFDIAHRPVNFYVTDAQSDYEKIAIEVEKGIAAALLEEKSALANVGAIDNSNVSMDEVKATCLMSLLDESLRSSSGSTIWSLQKEVSSSGISERMVALAIVSLLDDEFVIQRELSDQDGDKYNGYLLSEKGQKHLMRSYSALMQQERERVEKLAEWKVNAWKNNVGDLEDDIPF